MEVGTVIQCQEKYSRLFKNLGCEFMCKVVEVQEENVMVQQWWNTKVENLSTDENTYPIKKERLNKFDVVDEDTILTILDKIALKEDGIGFQSLQMTTPEAMTFHTEMISNHSTLNGEKLVRGNTNKIQSPEIQMLTMLATPSDEQERLKPRYYNNIGLVESDSTRRNELYEKLEGIEQENETFYVMVGLPQNITEEEFEKEKPANIEKWADVPVLPFNYGYKKMEAKRKMYKLNRKGAPIIVFYTNQVEDNRCWLQFAATVAKECYGFEDTAEKILAKDYQGAWECQLTRVTEWVKNYEKREREKTLKQITENIPTLMIKPLQASLKNYENKVKAAEENFIQLLNEQKRLERELFYRTHNNAGQDEFAEYLKDMNDVVPRVRVNVKDQKIYFKINTNLCFWDDDKVESIIKHDYNYEKSPEYVKKIVKHILERKCILRMETNVFMDLKRSEVNSDNIDRFGTMGWGLPNPHIDHYNCWGGNSKIISEHLTNGNVVAAMAQMIAALSSLTLGDSAVMNVLFKETIPQGKANEVKCIERDGELFTIIGYIKKYEEEFK